MEVKNGSVDQNLVEKVADALVREYLHGKGYQKTLLCIDSEMIRTDDSITSRSLLAKLLHLEKLLKKNKQHDDALKTMLEVLVKYFLCHSKNKRTTDHISVPKGKSVAQRNIRDDCAGRISSPEPAIDQEHTMTRCDTSVRNSQQSNCISLNLKSSNAFDVASAQCKNLNKDLHQDSRVNLSSTDFSDEFKKAMKLAQNSAFGERTRFRQELPSRKPPDNLSEIGSLSNETICALDTPTQTCDENVVIDDIYLLSGKEQIRSATDLTEGECDQHALSTTAVAKLGLGKIQDDEINNAETKLVMKPQASQHKIFSGPVTRGGLQSDRSSRPSAMRRRFHPSTANHPVKLDSISPRVEEASVQNVACEANLEKHEEQARKDKVICEEVDSYNLYEKSVDNNSMGNRVTSEHAVRSPNNKTNLKIALVGLCGDMEVGDLDELDESNSGVLVSPDHCYAWLTLPQGTPIQYEVAVELKTLLLGSCKKDFPLEWKMQSFCLSTNPKVNYGIVQKKGGPCGVLACVQAYIIKELMFAKTCKGPVKGGTTDEECKKGLANALANILWKIGRPHAVLVMPTNQSAGNLSGLHDGFVERISLLHFTDLAALQCFLTRHVSWYMEDNNYSCISFLYSAILTRGLETVKNDMDDPKSCLIGTHGYCSQEVVNLLLTGCASTNVFDNVITLDDGKESRSILKGVTCQSEIGFLALFEHYNSCQVGDFLKCPRCPIWVICSESHFSVLFAKDYAVCESALNNENIIDRFDLYYYDGLLHQEDEIKLTINLSNKCSISYPNDLVPPLDLCIRTKWKDAHVQWSGIEPLL